MAISHVSDKADFNVESTYGTDPGSYGGLASGIIQKFSFQEVENMRKIGDLNNGHKYLKNEPGFYYVQGTLETLPTKSSLPALLEAFFGGRTDVTDYTITSDSDTINSYTARASYIDGTHVVITGLVFTTLKIDVAKDGDLVFSMDYIAQKLTPTAGSISPSVTSEDQFTDMDLYGAYGGNNLIMDTFSATFDWKIDPRQGRGMESVASGSRRLISRVIKNRIEITGSVEAELDDDHFSLGYEDEKTDSTLALNYSRGTDNAHAINFTGVQRDNPEVGLENSDDVRKISVDFSALDFSATGDLA